MVDAVRRKYRGAANSREVGANGDAVDREVQGLVDKAVNGDFEAYGELYGIYRDRIYRYVFYQVRDRMVSEDLTEEIFVKAWTSIGQQKQGWAFSSWLYRIAHNHIIDYFRARRQHEQLTEAIPDAARGPEQQVEEKMLQQQLAEIMSCLTPQQRQLIILKYMEDLDNREISRIMKKRPGAIRVMQMRSLAAMREKMGGEGLHASYATKSL